MDRATVAEMLVPELPRLRRYAMALCRDNKFEADDLLQETMLRALEYCAGYTPGNFGSWLNAIMINIFRGRGKKFWREIPMFESDERTVSSATVTSGLDLKQAMEAAGECMPIETANTLLTTSLLGLTETEAATLMGVSCGTIKSRCSRGRKRLKEHLEPA